MTLFRMNLPLRIWALGFLNLRQTALKGSEALPLAGATKLSSIELLKSIQLARR